MNSKFNRGDLLRAGAGASAALILGKTYTMGASKVPKKISSLPIINNKPLERVHIGFVGVGGMGSIHVINILNVEGAVITAVCDIVPEKVERIQKWAVDAGFEKPTGYSKGERDFERMCEKEDLDIVMTATPWKWHVPVCVSAMKNGKHAATEVPAAMTIEDCWKLVENSEKYGKYCVMLENCCYDRFEMLMFNISRRGLLGELIHGECGYMHSLRNIKLGKGGESLWRTEHSTKRNGNLYPTHGLGPIAQCMNVNRGDKLNYLVSMSSNSRGLQEYVKEKLGPDSPWAKKKFILGDVNTSLIKTASGNTIVLGHDTNLPRPYSRKILLQGTKGIMRKYPTPKIHIMERSPAHTWEETDAYYKEFEHPVWEDFQEKEIKSSGHGRMDYIEQYRLINALRKGIAPDIDVYDSALWSSIAEVSEKSVAGDSRPVGIPDFTRGSWKKRKPLEFIMM